MDTFVKLRNVFRETFGIDDLEIFPEMAAKDVETWDSFNHINLIVAIEDGLDVTFSAREVAGMKNVGDLVTLLDNKGLHVEWPAS